jgi:hypothetical protein
MGFQRGLTKWQGMDGLPTGKKCMLGRLLAL